MDSGVTLVDLKQGSQVLELTVSADSTPLFGYLVHSVHAFHLKIEVMFIVVTSQVATPSWVCNIRN